MRVKKIEGVTNHDVKAVEYYLKEECVAHPRAPRGDPSWKGFSLFSRSFLPLGKTPISMARFLSFSLGLFLSLSFPVPVLNTRALSELFCPHEGMRQKEWWNG